MKFIPRFLYFLAVAAAMFFALAISTKAQDISLPRDVAEKALKAIELVPQLEARITTLEKVNKELEAAKLTPCAVAQNAVRESFNHWLNELQTADETKRKEVVKILKFTRKNGAKTLQSQCGYESKSLFANIWDAAKAGAPFAALLLAL